MNLKKLIIYDFNELFKILYEIKEELNYEIIEITKEDSLNICLNKKEDHLVIVKKLVNNLNNQILITSLPIKLTKLIEKLNIEFLKHQFVEQSQFIINDYIIDINAREISLKNIKLKLTEKEVNTIIYLSKVNKPISINELQTKVWDYHSDIETHTVETHVYRLRKKISKNFSDDNFIISKNNGYQIK